MKRLILRIYLAFILMILAVKANDIVYYIIEQYNKIIEDTYDDINKTINSLMSELDE